MGEKTGKLKTYEQIMKEGVRVEVDNAGAFYMRTPNVLRAIGSIKGGVRINVQMVDGRKVKTYTKI